MNRPRGIDPGTYLSFIISTAMGFVCETVVSMLKLDFLTPSLRLLIFIAGWFVIALAGVAVIKFINTRRIDYTETKRSIVEVSERFQIPGQGELFEIDADNSSIVAAERTKKHSNILYYSLSAKTYLNWIDYTYFLYLRMLRDKLQCTLIIGLHLPDHIKECKNRQDGAYAANPDADPNGLAVEYDEICRTFEKNARQILGSRVTFIRENEFYKNDPKKYAETFRNLYDSFVLYFARETMQNGQQDYALFKRRVSHMESTFPVWTLAEKHKRARLFVLDNRVALEVWVHQPLKDIRKRNDICFIFSNSLVDRNGRRIDVHSIDDVINLTDNAEVLVQKAQRLSVEEQELLISMLGTDEAVFSANVLRYNRDTYSQLIKMLGMIQEHYSFREFESKR